jgi:hypothetical protein
VAIELVVEDGTNVIGSNTLVSLEYADAYFDNHPFYREAWEAIEEEQRKRLLIFATRMVTSMFTWPATGFATPDGRLYTTFIPSRLLDAICEQAFWMSTADGNPDAGSADNGGLSELKIDVIQLKFSGSSAKRPVPVAVVRLLQGLGVAQNNGKVRRVQVGLA